MKCSHQALSKLLHYQNYFSKALQVDTKLFYLTSYTRKIKVNFENIRANLRNQREKCSLFRFCLVFLYTLKNYR